MVLHRIRALLKDEDGPTATEYTVLLALIIIIAIGAITALGSKVSDVFANITGAMPTGSSGS